MAQLKELADRLITCRQDLTRYLRKWMKCVRE